MAEDRVAAARKDVLPMLVASASGLTPRMPRETGQAPGG
jgi:hypothetical protein